jgi:hypothetical protein
LIQAGEPGFTALIEFNVRGNALISAQSQILEAGVHKLSHDRRARIEIDQHNRAALELGKSVIGIAFD